MSTSVFVAIDQSGNVRRAGISLHDVTRPQHKSEFTKAEWNSLWATDNPHQRMASVYAAKGWQIQEIPVQRTP